MSRSGDENFQCPIKKSQTCAKILQYGRTKVPFGCNWITICYVSQVFLFEIVLFLHSHCCPLVL